MSTKTDKEGWAIFEQAMVMLEDVPGETMLERIARLKEWYVQLQGMVSVAQPPAALDEAATPLNPIPNGLLRMEARDKLIETLEMENERLAGLVEQAGDQIKARDAQLFEMERQARNVAQPSENPAKRWEVGKNGWDATDEATREDL